MQKKLIALAIAGLASSAAFAQTNVTIYGIADMGVARVKADGRNSGWKIDNGLLSGSRLGFRGEEDLGSGLKAVFTLEYMLQPDTNAALGAVGDWTGSATRQAFVGLKGGFGTVVAGRLQGAGYNFACAHNPVAGGAFDTISKLNGGANLLSCGSGGRTNNSVAYVSPNFGGFTFEANHARVTEDANRSTTPLNPLAGSDVEDSYANLIRANYTNGPLSVSAVMAKLDGGSVFNASAADTKEWGVGADFDFGIAKIYGTYQDRDTDRVGIATTATTTLGVNNLNGDKWALGLSIPVMKVGSILLSYADFDAEVRGFDSDAWTIAYTHSLSKRTTLYGGYSDVNNDRLNNSATVGRTGGVPRAGGDASLWALGVRHSF